MAGEQQAPGTVDRERAVVGRERVRGGTEIGGGEDGEIVRAMEPERNRRSLEAGVTRDLAGKLTYTGYLHLDELLDLQRPLTDPVEHDELLFIVQHQTSELWLRLVIHELEGAMADLRADALGPCLKKLARVKQVQRQLFEQWAVLETLTPVDYARMRGALGQASGFQSLQYRLVEFLLGNKNAEMLDVFAYDPAKHERLRAVLEAPSLYDEFITHLARAGYDVPAECLDRDWSQPHERNAGLLAVIKEVYERADTDWGDYELCEELVDIEESFQLWRFRHMKTVERIIGHKRGTGGSSGVGFLRAALDLTFFPELLEVRTEIGA
jgi:tryptophan 2,3-dioxygenase